MGLLTTLLENVVQAGGSLRDDEMADGGCGRDVGHRSKDCCSID